MQVEFKSSQPERSLPTNTSKGDEEESDDERVFEIYNLLDERTQDLFSSDERVVLDALDWFDDAFHVADIFLPDNCLQQILTLGNSSSGSIARQAMFVLSQILSFPSSMAGFLLEHNILTLVDAKFPLDSTVQILRNLIWNSRETRDLMLEKGYLQAIASLFGEDQDLIEIADFCRGIVHWPLEFEPFGTLIFQLFERMISFFEPDRVEEAKMIALACYDFVRANENFLCAFVVSNMVSMLMKSRCEDPRFKTVFLSILSCIWNAEFEDLQNDLLRMNVIQYAQNSIDEECPNMSSVAVDLLADIAFYMPQFIEKFASDGIAETIIDMFASQPSAKFKRAAVHFLIVMLAMASQKTFQEIYGMRAFPVLLESINLVEPYEFDWALRILIRGISDDGTAHAMEYHRLLLSYDGLVEWLETIAYGEVVSHAQKAAYLLEWMSAKSHGGNDEQ